MRCRQVRNPGPAPGSTPESVADNDSSACRVTFLGIRRRVPGSGEVGEYRPFWRSERLRSQIVAGPDSDRRLDVYGGARARRAHL